MLNVAVKNCDEWGEVGLKMAARVESRRWEEEEEGKICDTRILERKMVERNNIYEGE